MRNLLVTTMLSSVLLANPLLAGNQPFKSEDDDNNNPTGPINIYVENDIEDEDSDSEDLETEAPVSENQLREEEWMKKANPDNNPKLTSFEGWEGLSTEVKMCVMDFLDFQTFGRLAQTSTSNNQIAKSHPSYPFKLWSKEMIKQFEKYIDEEKDSKNKDLLLLEISSGNFAKYLEKIASTWPISSILFHMPSHIKLNMGGNDIGDLIERVFGTHQIDMLSTIQWDISKITKPEHKYHPTANDYMNIILPSGITKVAPQIESIELKANLIALPFGMNELKCLKKLSLTLSHSAYSMSIGAQINASGPFPPYFNDALPFFMTELPDDFSPENLEILHIEGYKLTGLPDSISKMENLEKVILKDTHISQLPEGFLAKGDFIKKVDLSEGKLTSLIGDWYLPKLKNLNLSHNKLCDLSGWTLKAPELKELNLSNNDLRELPQFLKDAENYLPKLEKLYINSNFLNTNNTDTAEILQKLKERKVRLFAYTEQKQNDSKQEKSE